MVAQERAGEGGRRQVEPRAPWLWVQGGTTEASTTEEQRNSHAGPLQMPRWEDAVTLTVSTFSSRRPGGLQVSAIVSTRGIRSSVKRDLCLEWRGWSASPLTASFSDHQTSWAAGFDQCRDLCPSSATEER